MAVTEWWPGAKPPPPVYIDASILAASFVAKDKRYKQATQLFADLMVDAAEIVISPLTLSESTWALAKMSYHELLNQPFTNTFHPGIFEKHAASIFAKYRGRMNSVYEWLRDWRAAGVDVTLFPSEMDAMQDISRRMPIYMEKFTMASSDAMHLAAAEMGAKSFVTGDSGFQGAGASSVEIYYIPK
ncbi:MAG: PIN domain-containing protein [Acidobacteriota bacterium]